MILELERSEILREFTEWDKQGTPELVKAYSDNNSMLIVRVFTFVRYAKGVISVNDVKVDMEYTFPIAKVLKMGKGWRDGVPELQEGYQPGRYVRMRDHDCMTYPNARYEVWVKNAYKNAVETGHTSQIGNPEPRHVMNLWKNLGARLFNPDPFDHTSEGWLSNVFFLDEGNVVMPIDDVGLLLRGVEFKQP